MSIVEECLKILRMVRQHKELQKLKNQNQENPTLKLKWRNFKEKVTGSGRDRGKGSHKETKNFL